MPGWYFSYFTLLTFVVTELLTAWIDTDKLMLASKLFLFILLLFTATITSLSLSVDLGKFEKSNGGITGFFF